MCLYTIELFSIFEDANKPFMTKRVTIYLQNSVVKKDNSILEATIVSSTLSLMADL